MVRMIAAATFLGAIVAANYATAHYGLVPVGPLEATAGTYFAGVTFIARDYVQDRYGRRAAIILIIAGALVSWALASPALALASGSAFLIAELADQAVYTPLRRRGYLRAALASNAVGALVDTAVFLYLAGFTITGPVIAGQMIAKLAVTALALALHVALHRQPLHATGA